jgi:hypothetical protein
LGLQIYTNVVLLSNSKAVLDKFIESYPHV